MAKNRMSELGYRVAYIKGDKMDKIKDIAKKDRRSIVAELDIILEGALKRK